MDVVLLLGRQSTATVLLNGGMFANLSQERHRNYNKFEFLSAETETSWHFNLVTKAFAAETRGRDFIFNIEQKFYLDSSKRT